MSSSDPAAKAREIVTKWRTAKIIASSDRCLIDAIATALEAERKAGFDERKELIEQEFRRGVAEGYRRGLEDAANEVESWWVEPKEFVKTLAERIRKKGQP